MVKCRKSHALEIPVIEYLTSLNGLLITSNGTVFPYGVPYEGWILCARRFRIW